MATATMRPGTILGVAFGPVTHVGILTERGTVISNTRRRQHAAEEPFDTFSGGREVKNFGYPSQLTPHEVIARARTAIGTPWDLFKSNCEHFVRWAHGLPVKSPQLQFAVLAALAVTLLLVSRSK